MDDATHGKCDRAPPNIVYLLADRNKQFLEFKKYINSIHDDDVYCSLNSEVFPCKKRIGSESQYGVVNRLYNRAGVREIMPFDVVVKTMDDIKQNREEIEHAYKFTRAMRRGETPHFVMTWNAKKCEGNKLILFSELFPNGDLSKFDVLLKGRPTVDFEPLLSAIMQILMALHYLNSNKLAHSDLHLGNVLVKTFDSKGTNFFVYHTSQGDVSIRHFDHLIALTDYGFTRKAGSYKGWDEQTSAVIDEMHTVYRDMMKLFGHFEYLLEKAGQAYRPLRKMCEDINSAAYERNENIKSTGTLPSVLKFILEVVVPAAHARGLGDDLKKIFSFGLPSRDDITQEFTSVAKDLVGVIVKIDPSIEADSLKGLDQENLTRLLHNLLK
jgi:serine/threonine protein kinase